MGLYNNCYGTQVYLTKLEYCLSFLHKLKSVMLIMTYSSKNPNLLS